VPLRKSKWRPTEPFRDLSYPRKEQPYPLVQRAKILACCGALIILLDIAADIFLPLPIKPSSLQFLTDMETVSRGSGQPPWPTESRSAAAEG
jgi:hypothetical protein